MKTPSTIYKFFKFEVYTVMKKEIFISLDQMTYERVSALCNGNEGCINDYINKALENQLSLESNKETQGLEEYLKTSNPSSRAYGIKGQGW